MAVGVLRMTAMPLSQILAGGLVFQAFIFVLMNI